MADENVTTPSEASPVASAATVVDGHKRKLEDFEVNNAPEAITESQLKSDDDSLKNGSKEEGNDGADESEAKRPRLESNGDNVGEADASASQNGHTENAKEEDDPKEESEQHEPEDKHIQSLEGQEPVEEPIKEANEETAPDNIEKNDVGSAEEPEQPDVVTGEPSDFPREGDVPIERVPGSDTQILEANEETAPDNIEKNDVGSAEEPEQPDVVTGEPSDFPREGDVPIERVPGSDTQILSRKMEVPNDKVGVLIGKAGDTIRSLQDNSGAKIQIVRDADADPKLTSRPLELVGTLESINRAERLIKDVIAEADAGGSPSLVARGFSTVQAASGGELLEIQVPIEKVGLIIGKGGETIRNLQTRSGARIQLIQPNDGDQSREKMVRVTGNKKQIETAREMIKDVMNQTIKPSPLSGGYNQQQGYRPRGPVPPQWGPRGSHHAQYSGYDYPHRGQYPSQSSQYPPSYGSYPPPQAPRSNFGPGWEQRPPSSMHGPSPQGNYNYGQQPGPDYGHPPPYPQAPSQQPYGHGYNEPKYDHPPSAQHYGHMGSQSTPYAQGGAHSGYGGPPDQYGKPPMYGMQAPAPHSQPYGLPRPTQPGEVPYQGPGSATQSYGQPPQQSYNYGSSAPMQQTYPPYGGTTEGYGHTPAAAPAPAYPHGSQQPVAGYGQQPAAYPQTAPAGGYGSYPTAQPGYTEQQPAANTTTYGYQGPTDPSAYPQAQATYPATGAGQSGYAQPTPAQPTYDQSGGYGTVPAAASYAKSASPQPTYPQYDSSQMYGTHR